MDFGFVAYLEGEFSPNHPNSRYNSSIRSTLAEIKTADGIKAFAEASAIKAKKILFLHPLAVIKKQGNLLIRFGSVHFLGPDDLSL